MRLFTPPGTLVEASTPLGPLPFTPPMAACSTPVAAAAPPASPSPQPSLLGPMEHCVDGASGAAPAAADSSSAHEGSAAAEGGSSGAGGGGEAGSSAPVVYPDEWDSPTPDFEAFISDIVKHRIGKYEQPEHPNRISHEEAASIFRKIRREIIAKEHEAYSERRRQNLYKPILRAKLEHRVKEFVRETVKRTHMARS